MFLIVLVVVAVTVALPYLGRQLLVRQLARLLAQKRFDAFYRTVDGPLCRVLCQTYDREYFRLNAYSLQQDAAKVDAQYQKLLGMRLRSVQQEKNLVLNAFSYYLNSGNAQRTAALLPRLQEAVTEEEFRPYQMMYRVLIQHRADCIPEMEAQLAGADELSRGVLHYLLSLQYGYLGRKAEAEEHLRLSRASSDQALAQRPAKA